MMVFQVRLRYRLRLIQIKDEERSGFRRYLGLEKEEELLFDLFPTLTSSLPQP